jgi:phosphoribosylformimino-5-aminoimidazole carboxamide ribotide isomerase
MIELIPAIDIIGGKCVRLKQGDYARKNVYSDRPAEIAARFEQLGIRRLHLVDLDGAAAGHVVNLDILEDIAGKTSLNVDFGGGLKSIEDIRRVFDAGATMVTAGSAAVRDPEQVRQWLQVYGPDRILLGADIQEGRIAIRGWQEETDLHLDAFVAFWIQAGITTVICTDIERDGMLRGPAMDLYGDLRRRFPRLGIIASGGVASMRDILDLEAGGLNGVIFGKAFYEGRITEDEIVDYLKTG